jgi:hypothetical protein
MILQEEDEEEEEEDLLISELLEIPEYNTLSFDHEDGELKLSREFAPQSIISPRASLKSYLISDPTDVNLQNASDFVSVFARVCWTSVYLAIRRASSERKAHEGVTHRDAISAKARIVPILDVDGIT